MSAKKAQALTLVFPAFDPNNRPSKKTGITFSTGDVKVSRDGASFVNATNLPTEISGSGRYSLVLTAAEMFADLVWVMITNALMDDVDQPIATDARTIITAQTASTGTAVISDRSEATNDTWKDVMLEFRTGALAGQVKKCTSYTGSTKTFNFTSGFTGSPANGDYAAIVND